MASNNRNRKDPRFNQNWEGHEGRDGHYDRNFDGNSGYNDLNYNNNSSRFRNENYSPDPYGRDQNFRNNNRDTFRSSYRGNEYERNGEYGRSYDSARNNWDSDRTNDYERLGSVDNYTGRYGNNFNRDGFRDPSNRDYDRQDHRQHNHNDYDREQRGLWDRTVDEVSSWFGDDDAERRRRMDRQQGEFRGRGPKGYRRSDERIKDDINDRLSDDSWVDASDIEVSVENGEATLTGTVSHRNAKRRAEDLAESVSGVTNVENRLRVQQEQSGNNTLSSPGAPSDTKSSQHTQANGTQKERSKTLLPT